MVGSEHLINIDMGGGGKKTEENTWKGDFFWLNLS